MVNNMVGILGRGFVHAESFNSYIDFGTENLMLAFIEGKGK
jgi:hypothetical protein